MPAVKSAGNARTRQKDVSVNNTPADKKMPQTQSDPASQRSRPDAKGKSKKEDAKKEEKEKAGASTEVSSNCMDCGKPVLSTQSGLKCDACDWWHHCECEQVDDDVYEFLCEHENETSLQWCCKKCTAICGKMKVFMTGVNEHQLRMEERFEELSTAMSKRLVELEALVNGMVNGEAASNTGSHQEIQRRVEEKVDALATVVKEQQKVEDMHLHECVQRAISVQRREEMDEKEEIRQRRTNVMIHGLHEPAESDAEVAKAEDEESILNLLHIIKCDSVSVSSMTRLGKKSQDSADGKPRPILLSMASEEQKDTVMSRAKNLRGVKGMEKVFCTRIEHQSRE